MHGASAAPAQGEAVAERRRASERASRKNVHKTSGVRARGPILAGGVAGVGTFLALSSFCRVVYAQSTLQSSPPTPPGEAVHGARARLRRKTQSSQWRHVSFFFSPRVACSAFRAFAPVLVARLARGAGRQPKGTASLSLRGGECSSRARGTRTTFFFVKRRARHFQGSPGDARVYVPIAQNGKKSLTHEWMVETRGWDSERKNINSFPYCRCLFIVVIISFILLLVSYCVLCFVCVSFII